MKTLKDFDWMDYADRDFVNQDKIRAELRQAAIEWIKELDNCTDGCGQLKKSKEYLREFTETTGQCDDYDSPYSVIAWIKHFFNITEEDLKTDEHISTQG